MNSARIRVSTRSVDPEDADDFWRGATRPFFVTEPVGADTLLEGSISALPIGTSLIGETTFNAQKYTRNKIVIAESGLDDQYMIQVVLDGQVSGDAEGVDFVARPGDVTFLDLGRTWTADAEAEVTGRTITLLAPRSLVEAESKGRSLHGTVLRGVPAFVLAQCMQSVVLALPHLDPDAAAGYEDVVASLLRVSLGIAEPDLLPRPDHSLRDRAYAYIAEHLSEIWLGPTTMCAALSVSRAQLYRAFASDGGIALVIRRKRLELVYRELTRAEMSNETIEALAQRCGFTSKSQLARAFKDFYGMTPSQARTDGRRTIGDPSIARLHRRLRFFSP
ncbi:AraC family transcriptional regulator [Rhodococcus erythropolis]|uniref:helix-turn-helix domain-containing protein n=1 Tax=Rhodococcus erythropolis TaxID=1833 RepID=UPI001E4713B7|nr:MULTISPECIES: AraC family transcriptional regulator [Rhodococcus erythropolis group]MCD2105762.1 AraC family transcriptional regulator [Rhodococcus qingshengii]MCZ4523633.1 AraC family transcriptional regulator [Rhodococcus erythropolis]